MDSKRYEILGKPVIPVKNGLARSLKELEIEGVILVSDSLKGVEKK